LFATYFARFLVEVASFSTSASTIHAIFQLPAAVRTKVLNNISLRQSLFRSRPVLVSTVPSAQPSEGTVLLCLGFIILEDIDHFFF
jgi:hypothetical protein